MEVILPFSSLIIRPNPSGWVADEVKTVITAPDFIWQVRIRSKVSEVIKGVSAQTTRMFSAFSTASLACNNACPVPNDSC